MTTTTTKKMMMIQNNYINACPKECAKTKTKDPPRWEVFRRMLRAVIPISL